jgi:hypothetical protein
VVSILENTRARLVVKLGNRFTNTAMCILDKTAGTARFERTVFMWPRKPVEVQLGDVVGIDVVRQSTDTTPGKGYELNVETYYPCVHLRSGKTFYLSQAPSEEATTEVVGQMCQFLGLQTGSQSPLQG